MKTRWFLALVVLVFCANILATAQADESEVWKDASLRTLIHGCTGTQNGGSCKVADSCLNISCMIFDPSWNGCSPKGGPGQGGVYWSSELSGKVTAYWSSSQVEKTTKGTWAVTFLYGKFLSYGVDNASYGVRCVRKSFDPGNCWSDDTIICRPIENHRNGLYMVKKPKPGS